MERLSARKPFNHSSDVAVVTPTHCPKSVRNRYVIEFFGGVFVLSRCLINFSVGVGAFVTGLSEISSFFSNYILTIIQYCVDRRTSVVFMY